jgi:imidazolonepropionase-like amidohydrolase
MKAAFLDGTVIIGDGTLIENGVVVVEKDKIVKVTEGNGSLPRDTKKISLAGKTLLPGFIDCHVHLCSDCSPDPLVAIASEPPAMTALKGAEFARQTLMGGVTTVRDMGGKDGVDIILRDAVQSGMISGPRMVVSGKLICMTGGHGWPMGREADGPDAVRSAAREQIKAGADIIKLMATGGVLTPNVEPGNDQLTEDELRAGVEEAHKAGKRTAAHAQGTKGILNALKAGIDSIEHGIFLDEETIALMVARNVPLIPTISPLYYVENACSDVKIPEFILQKVEEIKPFIFRSFRMAHEAGVVIGMGTDAGTPLNLHGKNLRELKLLVEGGFTPMQAIVAGTGIAAKILGIEEIVGTIGEGKTADLVMVDGNPLEDIDMLLDNDNLCMILQNGKLVKSDFSSDEL